LPSVFRPCLARTNRLLTKREGAEPFQTLSPATLAGSRSPFGLLPNAIEQIVLSESGLGPLVAPCNRLDRGSCRITSIARRSRASTLKRRREHDCTRSESTADGNSNSSRARPTARRFHQEFQTLKHEVAEPKHKLEQMETNSKNGKILMKSIIPRLAIPVLAALALVGCNQNSPGNSTETASHNSKMNRDNGMMAETTNMPATNTSPHRDVDKTDSANDATR
jgi:hypothetical protein